MHFTFHSLQELEGRPSDYSSNSSEDEEMWREIKRNSRRKKREVADNVLPAAPEGGRVKVEMVAVPNRGVVAAAARDGHRKARMR